MNRRVVYTKPRKGVTAQWCSPMTHKLRPQTVKKVLTTLSGNYNCISEQRKTYFLSTQL